MSDLCAPMADEHLRLEVLRSLRLQESSPDSSFLPLVRLAAQLAGCPSCVLSVLESDVVRPLAWWGWPPDAMPRETTM